MSLNKEQRVLPKIFKALLTLPYIILASTSSSNRKDVIFTFEKASGDKVHWFIRGYILHK